MYANESVGDYYPPMSTVSDRNDEVGATIGDGICDGADAAGFFFEGDTVYPEYLSDVNVMICPSDSEGVAGLLEWHENGDASLPILPCNFDNESYTYIGYMINEQDILHGLPEDILNGPPFATLGDATGLGAAMLALNLDPDVLSAFFGLQGGINAGDPTLALFGFPPAIEIVQGDLDVNAWAAALFLQPVAMVPALVTAGLMAGHGHTLLRLREGIERFLVTDINNPAGSARAQSEIYIMNDRTAIGIDNFSHVPGGANQLYMDGHVAFIKYPGDIPVDRVFAYLDDGR